MWQNIYDKCSFWLLVLLMILFKISKLLLIEKFKPDRLDYVSKLCESNTSQQNIRVWMCYLFYKVIGRH